MYLAVSNRSLSKIAVSMHLHPIVFVAQSEVVYSDYGNKEIVDNDKIVELPECLMQLNPLAARFSLYGIQAVDDPVLFAKVKKD